MTTCERILIYLISPCKVDLRRRGKYLTAFVFIKSDFLKAAFAVFINSLR